MTYTYGVIFGMCKAAVDRMARDMAIEFQPHNVASISLWQGLTASTPVLISVPDGKQARAATPQTERVIEND